MSIFDIFRRKKSGTASPSPDSERGDWMDWFLNREGPAGRFRGSRRPRYGIDYLFNGGGSVRSKGGPISPRAEPTPPFNGPYRPDWNREPTPPFKGPYRPDWNREPAQPFPLGHDDRGVMTAMADNPMVQQIKGFYETIDPWIPNLDGNSLGYEWERPLLGGTLGYGMDYDMEDEGLGAFVKWKLGIGT